MANDLNSRINNLTSEQLKLYRALTEGHERISSTDISIKFSSDTDTKRLSLHQHGLLQHHVPGVIYRNQSLHLALQGDVRIELMQAALTEIAARHEGLRVEFPKRHDAHELRIRDQEIVDIAFVDLCGLTPEDIRAAITNDKAEFDSHAFDVEHGPLYKFRLTKIADQQFIFSMLVDHLIFDGWSFGIVVTELNILYNQISGVASEPLTHPNFQFSDYARWEKESADEPRITRAKAYWLDLLQGEQSKIEARNRPQPGSDFVEERLPIAAGTLSQPLQKFSRSVGVSSFVTTFAIFRLLAIGYGAFKDEPIASSAANRLDPATHGLIGPISSCLLINENFDENLTFDAYVVEVARAVSAAMANQIYCPCALAEEAGLVWQYPFYFTFQNYPAPKIALADTTAHILDVNYGVTHADIAIFLSEDSGQIAGQIAYNAAKFDAQSAARIWDNYLAIATKLLKDPQSKQFLADYLAQSPLDSSPQ